MPATRDRDAGAPGLASKTASERDVTEPHVLIADDDPRNHQVFAEVLEGLDLRLTLVRSGRQALTELLKHDFAAIVLDVRMPGMDGFETAKLLRARERTRHVPIIFVTAYGQDEVDIRHGYRLGAVDYLFKPIVSEALRAKLQVFADLYRRTAEVKRQADWIREVERRDNLRRLEHERRTWEAAILKQKMEEQERLNAHLADVDRRKDEFIALLAHELRNPLAPIVTSLEVIRARMREDEPLVRAASAMGRQVHHLTRLLDDLLDVSRITRGKVELKRADVDLGELVRQAIEWCKSSIDVEGHRLTVVAPDGVVPIHADPVRMIQVLSNLINNAVRYSDPGSAIRVRWGREGDRAVAHVSDNGHGIRADMLDRIFDSFVQGSERSGGLGLGLTLVKRIVEMHDGSVEAHSDGPGRGSEFVVRLPLSARVPAAPIAVPRAPARVAGRPLCVAVIEDDSDVRAGLADVLELWGHEVHVANSGPEGVALLLDRPYDVALVDIGLPGIDGYTVAQRVRAALGDRAPVLVALTGFGQDRDRASSASAGFYTHMVKPPDLDDLRGLLAEAGAARPLAEATPPPPARSRSTPEPLTREAQ